MVLDGIFIRLRDIGGTSQVGLVRCIPEKDRSWLEELSDIRSSVSSPRVGQLVAFMLQTRAGWTKVTRRGD